MTGKQEWLRENAYSLLKAGDTGKALCLYEILLRSAPGDADVMGLCATCLFQLGKTAEAMALWRGSLDLDAPVRIAWRNFNNLAAAVLQDKDSNGAGNLKDHVLPAWPADGPPTEKDVALAHSLAEALVKLGRADEIERLLSPLAAQLDVSQDAAFGLLLWAVSVRQFNLLGIAGPETLERKRGHDPQAKLLLAAYHAWDGNAEDAHRHWESAARTCPIYVAPRHASQRFTIGVLNRPRPNSDQVADVASFHFSDNTPAGLMRRLSDRYRLISIFPFHVQPQQVRHLECRPQLILNNWVTAEVLLTPMTLPRLQDFVSSLDLPVVNPPAIAAQTTRQILSQRLQGIDGLIVPRVSRFANYPEAAVSIAHMLQQDLGFPFILRETFQQMGRDTFLVGSVEDLLTALRHLPRTQLYAIAFVDNPALPGVYRKLRAAVIGDDIYVTHVQYRDHWNVHRERDDKKRHAFEGNRVLQDFAERAIADTENLLGRRAMSALQAVKGRVGLDLFGIDFDLTPDGQVLFFEANAAMHLSFRAGSGNADVRHRMTQSLDTLFQRFAR